MDIQIKSMVAKFKDRILEEERDMKERTGITSNMETSEIEDYVKSVIKEIEAHKEKKKIDGN
jgi:hypothetical protein